MSNELTLYTTPQADQAPTDIVTDITRLAQRGVRDVLAYSMAIDRLPEEDKAARREALKDHRSKTNLEFLTLYVGPPKTRLIPLLDSTGEPVRHANGDVVMYEEPLDHPYQQLINQLTS